MIQVVFATSACQRSEEVEYAFGLGTKLPWERINQDFLNFKSRTSGPASCVLMGRRTFETLPCALPGRGNIVISSREYMPHAKNGERPHAMSSMSLKETLEALQVTYDKISVIGGVELIKEAIPLADRVIHSTIETGKYLNRTHYFTSDDMKFRSNPEFEMKENHWWDLSHMGYLHLTESVYDRKI